LTKNHTGVVCGPASVQTNLNVTH